MRLIDADALLKKLDDSIWYNVADFNEAWYAVDHAPTVESVPVRHGRWEWDGETFVCSACGSGYEGQPTMMGKPMFEFCPVCGADMRKDGDGDDRT